MKSKRTRFFVRFILVVAFCCLGVAYLMVFHLDALQHVILDQITRAFGGRVTIQDVHVGFSPYPQLELVDVRLHDQDGERTIFQASHVFMDLSVLSLMQDAVTPRALSIRNAHLDLERDEQGQWNYQTVLRRNGNEWISVQDLFATYSLELVQGSISIEDRYGYDVPFMFQADEVDLWIDEFVLGGPMEISLSARLSNPDAESSFSSSGTLENVEGFLDVESSDSLDSAPRLDLDAKVELDRTVLLQLAKLFNAGEIPVGLQSRTKAQGHVHFAPGVRGYDLIVSDLAVLTDVLDLNGEVSLAGLLQSDPPTFSGKWAGKPLDLRHLPTLLPVEWIPPDLSDVIRRRNVTGKVETISAKVFGTAREGLGYSLTGEFQVSEGTVTMDPGWGTAEEIQGKISVKSDQIQLVDFRGRYELLPVTSGTGTIVFKDEGPWLTTTLKGAVSSHQLLHVIRRLFDWNVPRHPMNLFTGQAGNGLMTIRFAGPLQNPDGVTFRRAEYHPEQVTLQVPGLRDLLTHVGGTFTFSPTQLGFKNVTGFYRQSDFRIDGRMNFEERPFMTGLRVQGNVMLADLLNEFSASAAPGHDGISGKAAYRVLVDGPLETPNVKGRMNLHGVEMQLPGLVYKSPALGGTLDFALQVGNNHRLSFEHALTVHPVRLTGRGSVRYGQTPFLRTSLRSKPISLESLPKGLEMFDEWLSAGTLEVSLALQGKGTDWRSWKKSGWIALTDGVMPIETLTSPFSHVFLRIKLHGHTAELKRVQWNVEQSRVQMTGVVHKWDRAPDVKLELTSPEFDLALFKQEDRKSALRKFLERLAESAKVAGSLKFDRAWYKDLHLTNVTGRFAIDKNVIGVDPVRAKTDTGMIEGRVLMLLPVDQPATVKTWFDVKDVPLLTLERTFLDKEALEQWLITGIVSAEGLVQGHGNDPRWVLPTLNGNFRLSVKDGSIKKGTVIPKILTIMNLPTLLQGKVDVEAEGYPFDRQTGTFAIKNGVIVSKDIVLDGPILTMTAAGEHDLVNDHLNGVATVSPLGPYFNLFRQIPLFGMLLDGQEGFKLAMFQINGSFHDPLVELLPLESFQSGLMGFAELAFTVLKNTLSLPQKIIFPDANAESVSASDDATVDEEEF